MASKFRIKAAVATRRSRSLTKSTHLATPPAETAPPSLPNRKRATKRDVAREYRVSVRTVDQWLHDRKIPYLKISPRVIRFDLDAVERALGRYSVQAVS
jgi:hypothetical protein